MHDRLVPFDAVLNFRDFGGYDTAEGPLPRGRLYRSAAFHDASDADLQKLDAMGVRFIVDLRRPEERTREPNRWPGEATRTVFNEEGQKEGLPPHLQALMQGDLSADGVREFMLHLYRQFAHEPRHVMLYREWFKGLMEEGGPSVIHCAAGKDRTGLGCALTLHALGVSDEAIMADYEFTNAAIDLDTRLPRIREKMEERLGRSLSDAALKPMLGVEADYLRTAFAVIEAENGSIDAYLTDVLGVDAPARRRLREKLTA